MRPQLHRSLSAASAAGCITSIGLAKHLSPTRSNGLAALLEFIRTQAQARLAAPV